MMALLAERMIACPLIGANALMLAPRGADERVRPGVPANSFVPQSCRSVERMNGDDCPAVAGVAEAAMMPLLVERMNSVSMTQYGVTLSPQ